MTLGVGRYGIQGGPVRKPGMRLLGHLFLVRPQITTGADSSQVPLSGMRIGHVNQTDLGLTHTALLALHRFAVYKRLLRGFGSTCDGNGCVSGPRRALGG